MESLHNAWGPDRLGPEFQALTLDVGPDPDGEGQAQATLVAYKRDTPGFAQRPALLWVHGMTDYFFNVPAAEHFHALGYAFYAVDLRKCGRSRLPGQRWHYASDLGYYYTDLDAALEAIPTPTAVPMGHSTGGLICALWLADRRPARVAGLILNGPWLEMMSVPPLVVRALSPIINVVGAVAPKIPFPGGNLTAFGDSLHSSRHGVWDYDLELKPLGGHRKYVGWLRTILAGFARVRRGIEVGVPFLTICSTQSILGQPYSEASHYADIVVDAQQTIRRAPNLGARGTLRPVRGARHEAFASREPALGHVFDSCDAWLRDLYS